MTHGKRPAYSSSGYHHAYEDERNAKRKKAAVSDKPPMPKSAYVVFCNEMRPKVRKEFPAMDFVEITRHVAKLWKAISADERQFYEEVRACVRVCLLYAMHGLMLSSVPAT